MASFEKTHIVCDCNNVSLAEIIYSIEHKGCETIKDLQNTTDAGVTCKCCISKEKDVSSKKHELYLTQILEKFNKKLD